VEVGDAVLSLDPATGEQSVEAVTAVVDGRDRAVTAVSLSDGSGVVTTPGHRWWLVDGREFVRADHLAAGDRVLGADSGTLTVAGVETVVGAARPMVNLTVERTHTFYAGTTPVLVHNCGDLADDVVVVRGGVSDVPGGGKPFSGSYGATVEDAAAHVPHGQVRSTTVGEINQGGGSVVREPEPYWDGGPINQRHVNVTLGDGSQPFGPLMDNPVPKVERPAVRPR
jgi:hypothetical protein